MSGTTTFNMTFNGDAGPNYSTRVSVNGGADITSASQNNMVLAAGETNKVGYITLNILNNASTEKLIMGTFNDATTGAANVPLRQEYAAKWANTSNQINSITITQINTGDFAAGSQVIVLGHN